MHSTLLPVLVMVVESAAIYSSALISVIAVYAAGNNAQYIVLDLVRTWSLSVTSFRAQSYCAVNPAAHIPDRKPIGISLKFNQHLYTRASSSP